MAQHFLEYHTRIKCDLFVLVSGKSGENDFVLARQVFDGWPPGAYLPSQKIVEYLDDVLPCFKLEPGHIDDEVLQQISVVCLLCELGDELWLRVWVRVRITTGRGRCSKQKRRTTVAIQDSLDLLEILRNILIRLAQY